MALDLFRNRAVGLAAAVLAAAAAGCDQTTEPDALPVRWRFASTQTCQLRPPVSDGQQVYAYFVDGYVRAISLATGQQQWQAQVGGSRIDDIQLINGVLLVQTEFSTVRLDPADGDVLWSFTDAADRPRGILSVDDANQVVVAAGWAGTVRGLALATGQVSWTKHLGESGRSTLIIGRTVYVAGRNDTMPPADVNGHLYAINLDTRDTLWSFLAPKLEVSAGFGAPITRAGDLVVGPSANGRVYALNQQGGLAWSFDGNTFLTGAISDGQRVYVPSVDGHLYTRAVAGDSLWSTSLGGASLLTEPALRGASQIVVSLGASVHGIDRATGSRLWSHRLRTIHYCSAPLIVGEMLVLHAEDGIHAIELP